MLSYYGVGPDGAARFGAVAANLPASVHSIKPLLDRDEPMPALDGQRPSHVAFLMLQEAVRRSIEQLRNQRLLPPNVDRLAIATNLGCTPKFGLQQRLLLRDVAIAAGLNVQLASLIEEPVAAVYEVMLSGLVTDGRVLVVDMGGGTLDIAMVRISERAQRFELFASRGYERGGDKFTNIIVERLADEVRGLIGDITLSRADESLLWQRAEAAKLALSIRRAVKVDLAGIADITTATCEVTQDWFRKACGNLRVRVHADVTNVYRLARLILDRGGPFDPRPGTIDFEERERGRVRRLTQARLEDDGLEHIDKVVLVGGGTNMPMIASIFTEIFGEDRVIAPEIVGLDRSALVALGLARPKPPGMISLQFPNWGISAVFRPGGEEFGVPLYEPFAPAFSVTAGDTAEYSYDLSIPDDGTSEVALAFRPVGDAAGTMWPFLPLPAGARKLQFRLDIFGRFELRADTGDTIYRDTTAGQLVPWRTVEAERLAEWIPPRFEELSKYDGFDWRDDTK